MEKTKLVGHFGTQTRTAQALEMGQATVARWGEVVPLHIALRVEELTGGELKPDWDRYGLQPRKIEED